MALAVVRLVADAIIKEKEDIIVKEEEAGWDRLL